MTLRLGNGLTWGWNGERFARIVWLTCHNQSLTLTIAKRVSQTYVVAEVVKEQSNTAAQHPTQAANENKQSKYGTILVI